VGEVWILEVWGWSVNVRLLPFVVISSISVFVFVFVCVFCVFVPSVLVSLIDGLSILFYSIYRMLYIHATTVDPHNSIGEMMCSDSDDEGRGIDASYNAKKDD
jgi:hypothetical protein